MTRARRPLDWELARIRALLVLALLALGTIEVALWRLQVSRGQNYRRDLARQSVRRVRVPGPRGCIYDRHGRLLADNRPSYGLVLYLEELRPRRRGEPLIPRILGTLDEVAAVIGLPPQVDTNDLRAHIRRRLPLPLPAWRDLPEAAIARWAEMGGRIGGADLSVEPVRVYPAGTNACHVIGYVSRADLSTLEEEPYHYHLSDMAGAAGIEKVYDSLLRGRAGVRLVRVDAAGYRYQDLGGTEPVPGADLRLTLDLDLQAAAESALGEHHGALVALDPSDGAILAMASRPAYDPGSFVPAISEADWERLQQDPARPLFNRAVAAAYAPGSTFKPIVAIAALQHGRISPATVFRCSGALTLGNARFRCWDTLGHGALDLAGAIRYSCNVYFFHAGLATGPDAIATTARAVGLGRPTEVDLDQEAAGLVPDPAWKRRAWRDAWRDGDTCNLSIGQGPITATPLQMAVVAAALANGGHRVTPHLLLAVRPAGTDEFQPSPVRPRQSLGWPAGALEAVRRGMRDVVMAEDGTGRRMRVAGMELAGKTGTAEYGPKREGRKRGWMIAFGPLPRPSLAVAMVVEDAVSGGTTVAPRLQQFFAAALARSAPPNRNGGPQ
ncbi:MAG: penicillin-binding protein 2 [Kiritimatiellae bacterium]|nr:penicillin-binding protein 2 [Kiritimatiellia bacterium]